MEARIVEGPPMRMVGVELENLSAAPQGANENGDRIPQLWAAFMQRSEAITDAKGNGKPYGVCIPGQGSRFTYMAAVEVGGTPPVPAGMVARAVPAARYAVFRHEGEHSSIHETFNRIWASWLPQTGYASADGAPELEVYDETGLQTEIWIPIK